MPYTVIGINGRSFSFPVRGSRFNGDSAELFVPVSWGKDDREQKVNNFDISMIARLRPNIAIRQQTLKCADCSSELLKNYPPEIKLNIGSTFQISHWNHKLFPFAKSLPEMCSDRALY